MVVPLSLNFIVFIVNILHVSGYSKILKNLGFFKFFGYTQGFQFLEISHIVRHYNYVDVNFFSPNIVFDLNRARYMYLYDRQNFTSSFSACSKGVL